ncbi:hypothetical protein [uncultured Mitsuokella sp.]|uniref:hypothetical protein n=1 Tax=uncultured Mitsuokella sp. TaxID=453120 RepID=UPI002600D4E8|nr:hypothetical protein [uncultured Mitsuokella sp.]
MTQLQKCCKVCGRLFKPLIPAQSVCSMKCYNLAKAGICLVNAEKKPAKAKREPKPCAVCGTMFTPKNKVQKYCSDACARKAARGNQRRYEQRRAATYKAKPPEERTKVCPVCGKTFIAERESKVYCSNECLIKHSRAQREYGVVALEKPYTKHKAKHESHIEDINAVAKAHGMTYGQWQAEKLLARLHEEMN